MSRPLPARVLVTGASGFIGQHVCQALAARGIPVRALVRRPDTPLPASIERCLVRGLDDCAALRPALADVQTVVHLAASVHQPQSGRPSDGRAAASAYAINVDGTRTLLELGREAGIRDFVFASTVKVIGEGGAATWTEDTPPQPADDYGRTKWEAERLVRAAATQYGLHAPILRLPLVYGPGMRANALQLFRGVAAGLPMPFGAVRNRRSYLYVGNLVAALFTVLETPAGNDTFFVSDGADLSTPELITLIGEALGRRAKLVAVPVRVLRAAARLGDIVAPAVPFPLTSPRLDRLAGSLTVDIAKLRRLTGYRPPYTVREGLRAAAAWYLAQVPARTREPA